MSNLDARLRERMRGEIRRLVNKFGATAVYVTHDQDEALSMADRIAVMDKGRIIQVGTPQEVYKQPANRFVADFLGEANFFSGKVAQAAGGDGFIAVDTAVGRLLGRSEARLSAGSDVVCCIRPESVQLIGKNGAPAEPRELGALNRIAVSCEEATYMGPTVRYRLRTSTGHVIRAVVVGAAGSGAFFPGAQVEAIFSPREVVILEE